MKQPLILFVMCAIIAFSCKPRVTPEDAARKRVAIDSLERVVVKEVDEVNRHVAEMRETLNALDDTSSALSRFLKHTDLVTREKWEQLRLAFLDWKSLTLTQTDRIRTFFENARKWADQAAANATGTEEFARKWEELSGECAALQQEISLLGRQGDSLHREQDSLSSRSAPHA